MGDILSIIWRKKKSSLEELEEIEHTIHSIEEYNSNVENSYRSVGKAILYISTVVGCAALVIAYFRPMREFREKILFILFFVLFVILAIYFKKIMNWYYDRKIKSNRSKLFEVRQKKKQIIENVMEKETYKVAKEILEKYAPDRVGSKAMVLSTGIDRKFLPSKKPIPTAPAPVSSIAVKQPSGTSEPTHVLESMLPPMPLGGLISGANTRVDRFLQFLIGDGPSNRYALICKNCHTHNGMALKEEFPYLGFRCCQCSIFNPPRMLRPPPPQLMDSSSKVEEDNTAPDEFEGGVKDEFEITELDGTPVESGESTNNQPEEKVNDEPL